ncbi:hypothetical protein EMIHUDRAFT_248780 [Emiliania huxleyi CCMP1516]|uniref:Uncharacterized protein n=2 Tax=Emiliania huxleyi TaxID=2903 RepID=A0A0D3ID14_EMIH1|nr:hypothetical protein EMIHUDRAFT_248780 [Emiliania huxleyi CCMP1516]EOD09149.1 hypothetical protein EMIHUDRAFT_248780 [Emiliania huxleyi CCMP1516]|eukprot:XP_005761578.1 hypothetical protein EMIHUDRAFT_248780 [Emiliania huxleyi CCMP1516]
MVPCLLALGFTPPSWPRRAEAASSRFALARFDRSRANVERLADRFEAYEADLLSKASAAALMTAFGGFVAGAAVASAGLLPGGPARTKSVPLPPPIPPPSQLLATAPSPPSNWFGTFASSAPSALETLLFGSTALTSVGFVSRSRELERSPNDWFKLRVGRDQGWDQRYELIVRALSQGRLSESDAELLLRLLSDLVRRMSALLPGRPEAVGSAALRAKVLSGAVDAADVSRLVAAVHGPLTQLVAPVQDGEDGHHTE